MMTCGGGGWWWWAPHITRHFRFLFTHFFRRWNGRTVSKLIFTFLSTFSFVNRVTQLISFTKLPSLILFALTHRVRAIVSHVSLFLLFSSFSFTFFPLNINWAESTVSVWKRWRKIEGMGRNRPRREGASEVDWRRYEKRTGDRNFGCTN